MQTVASSSLYIEYMSLYIEYVSLYIIYIYILNVPQLELVCFTTLRRIC